MIQRIQSVWLLLAAIGSAATLKLPYFTGILGAKPASVIAAQSLALTWVTAAIVLLSLVAIFLYKKRKLQLRLCVLGLFLEAGLIYLYYRHTSVFLSGEYTTWSILHMLVLLFIFLAARG